MIIIEKSDQLKFGIASKVFLPVLAGLILSMFIYQIYSRFNPAEDGGIDSWSLVWIIALIVYPLLSLIQWPIVAFIWNRIIVQSKSFLLSCLVTVLTLSISFGVFLGYLSWARQFALKDLIMAISIVTVIQLLYWTINFFVLFALEKSNSTI
ncbi:hypothetical protein [Mucilaginibacter sp. UYCu711]|uniref:hypothetical protein n=1 Tax=Mucilaginibacter sp. UYCu711 TaxID=3156339 RepID=UPI003D1DB16C